LTHFGGPLTGSPRWSPDGKWIAFDSRPEGQADIYLVPSAGGAPRRFTYETAEDVVPRWSRDGKSIYFSSNRTGSWQIWTAPVEGGPKLQVTHNGGFAAIESEDGYLYYARSRSEPGLYRMPVEGGYEEPVLPQIKGGYWGYWALSREGIYFADRRDDGARPEISFLSFASERVHRLLALDRPLMLGDSAFALSPDNKTVLWTQVDQSGSDIMLSEYRR
jgi:dipeptidyl aminopeptidase/acylaminoacyl peptidase